MSRIQNQNEFRKNTESFVLSLISNAIAKTNLQPVLPCFYSDGAVELAGQAVLASRTSPSNPAQTFVDFLAFEPPRHPPVYCA